MDEKKAAGTTPPVENAAAPAAAPAGAAPVPAASAGSAVRGLDSTTRNVYVKLPIDELADKFAACKEHGYRFIQLCATTTDSGVELLYAFSDPDPHVSDITALVVEVGDGGHVPSASGLYPEAFVNENETHDLFGVVFDGLALDFEGRFYTVPVAYPMNPRAAQGTASAAREDAPADGAYAAGGADMPASETATGTPEGAVRGKEA